MPFHNSLSPIAFAVGPLSVRWYGLGFAFAFLAGEWLVRTMLVREKLATIDTGRLVLFALLGTVVGARLLHCAFYDPVYYLDHPWKILAVWEGGLASHGGVLGLVLGLAVALRGQPAGTLTLLLDRITVPAALGGAIVRLANFANSEIVGIPTNSAFGIVFDAVDTVARHPVQLYEAAAYLVLGAGLLALYGWTSVRLRRGLLTGLFLVGIFSARLMLEPFKVAQAAYESGYWVSVGQSLSIPFLLVGLVLVARALMRDKTVAVSAVTA